MRGGSRALRHDEADDAGDSDDGEVDGGGGEIMIIGSLLICLGGYFDFDCCLHYCCYSDPPFFVAEWTKPQLGMTVRVPVVLSLLWHDSDNRSFLEASKPQGSTKALRVAPSQL